MGFYDDEHTAQQYIAMAAGYDGRALIEILRKRLPDGATVLELGMGPGVDLDILASYYNATGSDLSTYFLDRYREQHPEADLLQLDAVNLATDRNFDAIYSNKVLHHLTDAQLATSLSKQPELLSAGGIVMHSFWQGEGVDEHHGLRFVYQSEASLRSLFAEHFKHVDVVSYAEMAPDDSLYVIATL